MRSLRRRAARHLFAAARHLAATHLGSGLIGWVLAHMSDFLPVDRLHETPSLLAFHHPRPVYALHILIMPKRAVRDLTALGPDDSAFYRDLFAVTAQLVAQFGLERCGYRLIANGGPYQDIPHLHFHLIAPEYPGA